MKIRITAATTISDGAGGRYRQGQVADVDDQLAKSWIEAGYAEPAKDRPAATEPETATNEPPKTTAARSSTRKKSTE